MIPKESAQIVVSRNAEVDIKMRGLEIFIDGQYATDLQFNREYACSVTPGRHTVTVSNHLYKKSLELMLAADERVELLAGNRFTLLGGLMVSVLGMGPYRVFLTETRRATITDELDNPGH